VGNTNEVVYAPGVKMTTNGDTISLNNYNYGGPAKFATDEENGRLITEAISTASSADVIIVAVGENEQMVRESGRPDRWGDAATLDLLSHQNELIKAMVATGKPVIVYLMNGRPLCVNYAAQNAKALIEGWFAGEEAGNALANILFGDVNPSGKLTISIPRSVGQLPVYYNRKPSAHAYEYVTQSSQPLFPFGYGLSYTTYDYSTPKLSRPTLTKDQALKVSVMVTNTGNRAGEETVQLYIHQKTASVTRPVKELKGFQKIELKTGESKTVSFTITTADLKYYNTDLKYDWEPGEFHIMIGGNSKDVKLSNVNWVK
jgi:beta-glucosidase